MTMVEFPLLSEPFGDMREELTAFQWKGQASLLTEGAVPLEDGTTVKVDTFVNEFWTSRQRAAHSLHEVSYRACFKPQLPRFFIERLTRPGDVVYDPFMGRGTTLIEAALLGRVPWGCDANPLSQVLVRPRLSPPSLADVAARLAEVPWADAGETWDELLVFYHPHTLEEIHALRRHLIQRAEAGTIDGVDEWIRMVAVNRLTGHSAGFFSTYSLPPNQAVSLRSQARINAKRGQTPPRRKVPDLILEKSRALLVDCDLRTSTRLRSVASGARLLTGRSDRLGVLPDAGVDLVVTSPPFLDVVDYATDNWLRCWFCGIDVGTIELTILKRLGDWEAAMTRVLEELRRVLRPGGHVAFEVGEVRAGTIKLEESVVRSAHQAGLRTKLLMINSQQFTKTANCWGVSNNSSGTNSNRIVLLQRS
jgi:hypothetical protein